MHISEPDYIREYRDVLPRFVRKEMPRDLAAEWDRTDTYPQEVVRKLADLGVMGLTIPEEYGGEVLVCRRFWYGACSYCLRL